MRNTRCAVCAHPDRAAIEAALLSGRSLRDAARQFGSSKDALSRHRPHISQELRAEVAQVADLDATSIAARLAASADDARDARRLLLAEGRFREAARMSDVEARSLGILADRLAVADLSQVALAQEAKAISAALRGVLLHAPEAVEGIVAEVRARGFDDFADELLTVAARFAANRTNTPEEIHA